MQRTKRILTTAALLIAAVVVFSQNKSGGINLSLWRGLQTQPINEHQTTYFNLGLISAQNRTHGLSINLVANTTELNNKGIQVSGIYSLSKESNMGLSIAGLFNVFANNNYGVAAAGLFTMTGIDQSGLAIGGIGNFTGYNTNGLTLAGLVNYNGDKHRGAQIAGVANLTGKGRGVQISGLANIAREEMHGVQLAAFNSANEGRGVQIGLVNYNRSPFKGIQLGLVNLNPKTKYQILLFGGNQTKINAALRFNNRIFYNQIGLGSPALKWGDNFSGAISYRTGIKYDLTQNWELSGDVGVQHINTFSNKDKSKGIPRRLYSLQARINSSYLIYKNIGSMVSIGYGTTRWYSKSTTYRKGVLLEAGLYYQI